MAGRRSKLDELSAEEREELVERLHKLQNGVCYVCSKVINLSVHKTDIDHIIALSRLEHDDESNWGLTHDTCNRSKGARDLQLQRILNTFKNHVESHSKMEIEGVSRSFTLNDALNKLHSERQQVGAVLKDGMIQLSFLMDGKPETEEFQMLGSDAQDEFPSFTGMIPFKCLHHDPDINPRSIVDLEPMIEEFYSGNPQLQPSLGTLRLDNSGKGRILLFDGQHKAAAQMYVGNPRLFVRVFVNCDRNRLKEVNFRAHTRLAQIHFPQLVEDRVGDDLFRQEFDKFVSKADTSKKSERSFFHDYLEQPVRADFRKYFGSHLRYEVLTGKAGTRSNDILNYVETISARSKRYPLSYETIQRTFLTHFIWLNRSTEPLDLTQEMRGLERSNLIQLMNIFVEEVLANNRFDLDMGIYRIEQKLLDAPDSIPETHLRAYRLCRSSAMIIWTHELKRALSLYLNTLSKYGSSDWPVDRPLWAEMSNQDRERARKMIRTVRDHKIWGERTNPEILGAISSTRQRDWKEILLQGCLPGRQEQLLPKLDQNFIFQNSQ